MTTSRKVRILCIDTSSRFVGPQSWDNKIHDFTGDLTDADQVRSFIRKHVGDLIKFIDGWPGGYDKFTDRVNVYIDKAGFHGHIASIWLEPVRAPTQKEKTTVPFITTQQLERTAYNKVVVKAGLMLITEGGSKALEYVLTDPEARDYEFSLNTGDSVMKRANAMINFFDTFCTGEVADILNRKLEQEKVA